MKNKELTRERVIELAKNYLNLTEIAEKVGVTKQFLSLWISARWGSWKDFRKKELF